MNKQMKPTDFLPALKKEFAIDRIEQSILLLAAHGFLTQTEKAKVRSRIVKWMENWRSDCLKVVKKP